MGVQGDRIERRKIMALGQSSRVISLPKPWLIKNDLDKGDMISILFHQDGSLVVHPEENVKEAIRKINLVVESGENENSIIRRIIGSYLDGYTIVELSAEDIFSEEQQKAIRQIISTLYMMIIESKSSKIVLETLIDETKASAFSGIERMHIITYSMCQDVLRSMIKWDKDLAKSVTLLEEDVDQLMFLLLRLIRSAVNNPSLAKRLDLDALDCLDYQTLVHIIEDTADCATSTANNLISLIGSAMQMPSNILNTLISAAEIAFSLYDKSVQCFLYRDIGPTNEIIDKQKSIEKLYAEITPLPIFGKPNETSILSKIIGIRENIMKIMDNAADIAELTIDRAYKS